MQRIGFGKDNTVNLLDITERKQEEVIEGTVLIDNVKEPRGKLIWSA